MADPELERREGPDFVLVALPAILPSVMFSFLPKIKRGGPPVPLS